MEWLQLPADELRRHLRTLRWVVTEWRPRDPSDVWTASISTRQPNKPLLSYQRSPDGGEHALRTAAAEALALRAEALDPETPAERLCELARLLPAEVRANPALPVLRVTHPGLFESVLPG
jgi:hypothetical protein